MKSRYEGANLKADVSYDAFTTSNVNASSTEDHEYEIMVWLAAYGGIEPIGAEQGPTATVTVGNLPFELFEGTNSGWTVYSFKATETVNSYLGDFNLFLQYLAENNKIKSDQLLQMVQAGTEPMLGSHAVFNVDQYWMSYTLY